MGGLPRITRLADRRLGPLARAKRWISGSNAKRAALALGAFVVVFVIVCYAPLPNSIRVIDGDTVRHGLQTVRLVGFDTPESGNRARCEAEERLADKATRRLRDLINSGRSSLQLVPCACKPGTEGTRACNFGRACGVLTVDGKDVGPILIREGLARPFVCMQHSCPPRGSWCL